MGVDRDSNADSVHEGKLTVADPQQNQGIRNWRCQKEGFFSSLLEFACAT